jgi:hypothetical protein
VIPAPKHKRITAFLLDMRTPGIDVRRYARSPARRISTRYFSPTRIPDSMRVGPLGGGWRVANTMLSNERALIGSGGRVGFRDLVSLAKRCGGSDDPILRQELARSYTRLQLIKWLGWRARSRKDQGLGPEASVLKLAASRRLEHTKLVMTCRARRRCSMTTTRSKTAIGSSSSDNGAADSVAAPSRFSARIGERVLGLPRAAPGKDTPFREPPADAADPGPPDCGDATRRVPGTDGLHLRCATGRGIDATVAWLARSLASWPAVRGHATSSSRGRRRPRLVGVPD